MGALFNRIQIYVYDARRAAVECKIDRCDFMGFTS